MLPMASHSRWIASPPLRRIAPATPPRSCRTLFAALTMASTSISVRSPCMRTIFSLIFMKLPWYRCTLRLLLCNSGERFLIITQDDFNSTKHHGASNQVRLGGHQFQCLIARRRILRHLSCAIQFIARVQEFAVVGAANEFIELGDRQLIFSEVAHFQLRLFLFQECLCLAAGRAIRLVQEFDFSFRHISISLLRNQNPPVRKKRDSGLANFPSGPRPTVLNKRPGMKRP